MKDNRKFINQLQAGQTVEQVFLVRDKDLRTTKTGGLFILCTLVDRTGSLPARMWQASEAVYAAIPIDGFLLIKGRIEDYKGNLQLIIDGCRPWASEKVDLADFMPVTELDVEQMWAELLEILGGVKDKHIKLLIKKFVEDHKLVSAFKKSPAALQLHHPFIGGLLEHTLAVARAAEALLPLYPRLNADLVLAGAFLHDIGKIEELAAGTSIQYTDRGQLVGHIILATIWVQQKAQLVAEEISEPFPQRTLDLIQHIILSHHGQYEFGSPKLPAVPEAFFLHHVDNLDAKVWMATHAIENDPDSDSAFTGFLKQFDTRLFKHSTEL
ncbi:MAG: HD domain-containing protein [Planctomycetes bacterium]|nr:HD domain-containing protein [Planctomycetota bacterium]